jgi:hypothetical protein
MKNFKIELLRNAAEAGGAAVAATPAAAAAAPAANATPGAAAGAAPYWPEGLDASFKGADEKTTLDNLAKTFGEQSNQLKGYRERDAKNLVPKTPEEYTNFEAIKDFKIDDAFKPHFENLKTDPAFKAIAVSAHKHGVGQQAMMDIYQSGLSAMQEAGLLSPALDVEAEKAALVPDAAKGLPKDQQDQAVQKRLNENYGFLDVAVANMGLPKDVAQFMELSLGDSAKGHQALEWVRGKLQGGAGAGPGAHGAQGGGGDTKESLRVAQAAIKANDPQRAQKEAEIDERYKKLYGE